MCGLPTTIILASFQKRTSNKAKSSIRCFFLSLKLFGSFYNSAVVNVQDEHLPVNRYKFCDSCFAVSDFKIDRPNKTTCQNENVTNSYHHYTMHVKVATISLSMKKVENGEMKIVFALV